ncbi:Galactokinase [Baekduia alba]|uniref:galactokinase n=1 Tax=Baekduia alba TaxID=2997333 RepID=UPI002341E7A7|nr:galactokinase family protein [Baekduia alba]WCB94582.1 Galactokinase [Baekduia alba]
MTASVTAFGPGRVNLIGEHTDYNGGLALPFAIAEGVTVVATAIDGDDVRAIASDFDGGRDAFPLADPPRDDDTTGWRAFVRGMVAELGADGRALTPALLEISGTLARGSGLSSSAALEVALALALLGVAGVDVADDDRLALARVCSRVENDWVGAQTGLLDQTASLLGRSGRALRIDFRDMDVTEIPLDLGAWTLVTADSGQAHSLDAAEGYNERRAECEDAARRLGVATVSEATPDQAASLPDPLSRRVRHVLEENARVDATVAALRAGDLADVGRLLDASHASLRDLYDASTDAVERTVSALRDAGAAGARMVGGGFGGHVLALLPPDVTPPPGARAVTPGPGAHLLR